MLHNPEVLFGGSVPMLALVEKIYACAESPELWQETLQSIAAAIGGDSLALFARFPESVVLAKTGIEDDAWHDFATYYAPLNPIASRCDAKYGARRVRFSHEVITKAELRSTEIYNDFYRDHGMDHFAGVSVPVAEGVPLADFSCQRSDDRGEFDAKAGAMLEALTPHLERSLRMSQTVKGLRDLAGGLDQALLSFDHAVFGVGPDGDVLIMSAAAELLVQANEMLRLTHGRLWLEDAQHDERLRHLIRGVAEVGLVDGAAAGGAMLVPRSDTSSLEIVITPLRQDDVLGFRRIAAMITVSDASRRPATRAHLMRSLFRLSPVETRMADLLLSGKDTREAGEALNISFETARFHVKRVLAKTGTKRQTELVRRMMALPGLVG